MIRKSIFLPTHRSKEYNHMDYQFCSTFKDLALQERIQNLCSQPKQYRPCDFLSIQKHICDEQKKIAVLECGYSAYPVDTEIIKSLLSMYINLKMGKEADKLVTSVEQLANKLPITPEFIQKAREWVAQQNRQTII